jgi:outer membrane lipoprotein-sorting protein
MKRISAIFLFVILSLSVSASEVDEVFSVFAAHPIITGTFVQAKTITRLNRALVSGGNFIIADGYGIVWETLKPFPSTMAVGRDFIIQSTASGAKSKLDAAGNETFIRMSDTISAVFSGDSKKLMANFENTVTKSGGVWTLTLVPKESAVRSIIAKITMLGDSVARVITLYEQSGDTIQYELSNHTFPGALTAREKAFFSAS